MNSYRLRSYTVDEVMDIFDVPRSTVYSWIRDGKIRKVSRRSRKNNKILISPESLRIFQKTYVKNENGRYMKENVK